MRAAIAATIIFVFIECPFLVGTTTTVCGRRSGMAPAQHSGGWWSGMQAREDHPHPAVRLHLMTAALMDRLPVNVKIPDLSDFAREAVNAARMVWDGLGLPLNRMRVFRGNITDFQASLEMPYGARGKQLCSSRGPRLLGGR
jgi:hypothetical protein